MRYLALSFALVLMIGIRLSASAQSFGNRPMSRMSGWSAPGRSHHGGMSMTPQRSASSLPTMAQLQPMTGFDNNDSRMKTSVRQDVGLHNSLEQAKWGSKRPTRTKQSKSQ